MKKLQFLVRTQLGKTAAIGMALWLGTAMMVVAASAENASPKSSTSTELELKGLLIPYEKAMLGTGSAGVIKSLKEEGSPIRTGEVVVTLEDEVEQASVEYQQALLDKRKWERESNLKLRKTGGSSLDEELTIKANLATAEAQLKQAVAILGKKVVHSSFDGVVVRRVRQVGEAVDQYFNVLEAVNVSKVYLETFLPPSQIKNVHLGDSVEVHVPDIPDRAFTGQVNFISPVLDPASGELRVKVLIDNADSALRAGMSAVGSLSIPNPETRGTASTKP